MKPIRIIAKLLIILLVLSFVSCDENIFSDYGDDSSDEAKLEQAFIYLDDGEYSKAKAILETLDQNDEEVKRALASCYAGLAGLDVPTLVAALDDTGDNTGLEAVGQVLGDTDNNNKLSSDEIDSKLSNVNNAISQYESLTLDSSVKAQLCILYSTRIVLNLANTISNNEGNIDIPLDDTINDQGYTLTAANFAGIAGSIDSDIQQIDQYVDDIDDALGTGNSLRDGFDEFISDLDQDSNGTISQQDIEDFFTNLDTL